MNLRLAPGKVLIEMADDLTPDILDGIILPQTRNPAKAKIGRCVAAEPFLKGRSVPVWRDHKLRYIAGAQFNEQLRGYVGAILVASDGRAFIWEDKALMLVRYEHVAAVIEGYDPKQAINAMDDIPRCMFCQSKGEGNIMLDSGGFCPECDKNAAGQKRDKARNMLQSNDQMVVRVPKIAVDWSCWECGATYQNEDTGPLRCKCGTVMTLNRNAKIHRRDRE